MGELLKKAEAIIRAHDATSNTDLRRKAATQVDRFLHLFHDRLSEAELRLAKEKCFRIEAARLGIKADEIDKHWGAIADIDLLFERTLSRGKTTRSRLATTLRPSKRSSSLVNRTVRQFRILSRREISALIRRHDLEQAKIWLTTQHPTDYEFFVAIWKLCSNRVALRQWKSKVEACYARLSLEDRKLVRSELIGFYWMLGDYQALEAVLPAKPRLWVEIPTEMETYVRLQRLSKATSLCELCEAWLSSGKRVRSEISLRLAVAQYYAFIGKHDKAIRQLSLAGRRDISASANYLDQMMIKIGEALLIASKQYTKDIAAKKVALVDGDPTRCQLEHQLVRIMSNLRNVVPTQLKWNWRVGCVHRMWL